MLWSASYRNQFKRFGIIAGSGPEAGVDLWSKLLMSARSTLGAGYKGDPSAPFVRIISSPALGLANDTWINRRAVHSALKRCVTEITRSTDYFTVACNVLQVQTRQLLRGPRARNFITFNQAVDARLRDFGTDSFVLLGAAGITSLGPRSIYASLASAYRITVPEDQASVDQLIRDIKLLGASESSVVTRMQTLIDTYIGCTIVLACTDFPLVPISAPAGSTIVDATEALASFAIQKLTISV